MSDMAKSWKQLLERFAALSKRERYLILGAVFLAPLVLYVELVYSPAVQQQQQLEQQYQDQLQSNSALELQLAELTLAAAKDPDADNRRQLERLQRELATFEQQLQQHLAGVVAPQQMPQLLKSMLKKRPGLTLVTLENKPPLVVTVAAGAAEADSASGQLYRHPLHMEFKGSYLDTLEYIRSLQRLPLRLFWQGLSIEMSPNYPEAVIKLDVYTLSLQKGWICG